MALYKFIIIIIIICLGHFSVKCLKSFVVSGEEGPCY